ncbi:MAG: lytic transglycosylase domain-containing protein [Chitinophagaceae bacterium]
MLNSTFSKTVFGSHLLLFISFPFISYQHPPNTAVAEPDDSTTAAVSAIAATRVELNSNAVKFVSNYIQKNNEGLVKIKNRSKSPFKTMDIVFAKYGLPLELKYLAVIESELKATAVSRVGAAGPWQLMPVTAKMLGLKVAAGNDERKQYNKSTKAAALYLRDLYREFGDWLLVMAAYNCGPGPVYKAIRKSGSHNFWALQSYLPRESREHVKKFIATHYYFEGNGSVTTLTKAENIKHTKMLMIAMAKEKAATPAKRDAYYKKQIPGIEQSIAYGY